MCQTELPIAGLFNQEYLAEEPAPAMNTQAFRWRSFLLPINSAARS